MFVLIIYTWVNSAQPKKKYKELETFNMALQRTSTHFQRFKFFMFNNTSNLGFSFFLRHMWFFHYLLTYCQDYSNCFELQQWKQKGKRGRIEKDFFSTFKEASEPRELALGLGDSFWVGGCGDREGVKAISMHGLPFFEIVLLNGYISVRSLRAQRSMVEIKFPHLIVF